MTIETEQKPVPVTRPWSDERDASDAPVWYDADSANGWASGYNAAVAAAPSPDTGGGSDAAKLAAFDDAHAVAVELGYPSITEALEALSAHTVSPSEAVGVAGTMPGSSGFTMASFRADDVPVGTPLYAHPSATERMRAALKGLISHVDDGTCVHEDLKRGGLIWTICGDCGAKWADDEGGFKPHVDAPAVAKARAALGEA